MIKVTTEQPTLASNVGLNQDPVITSSDEASVQNVASRTFDPQKLGDIPFIPADEDRLIIHRTIPIIATNIDYQNIDDLLTQAKVIMIGERHLMQSDRANISRVVNGFDSSKIQLILEGNEIHDQANVFPGIRARQLVNHAKLWDLEIAINKHVKFHLCNLFPRLYEGIDLLTCWSQVVRGEPLDLKTADVLINSDPETEVVDNRYVITLDSFRKAAAIWTEKYQKAFVLMEEKISHALFARNVSLVEKTKCEAEKTPENKIIVIAGSEHLVKSEKHQKAIEYVQREMRESNIPFVILDSTDSHQNDKTSIDRVALHQKLRELALTSLRGAVYPLSVIDPLIQELKPKYMPGMPVSTAAVEFDLSRLFSMILSLEYMKCRMFESCTRSFL